MATPDGENRNKEEQKKSMNYMYLLIHAVAYSPDIIQCILIRLSLEENVHRANSQYVII